jgi:hypothetical protein
MLFRAVIAPCFESHIKTYCVNVVQTVNVRLVAYITLWCDRLLVVRTRRQAVLLVQCGLICHRRFLCSALNVTCFLGHAVSAACLTVAACQMCRQHNRMLWVYPSVHSIDLFIYSLSVTTQCSVTPATRCVSDCFHLCCLFVFYCSKFMSLCYDAV